MAASLDKLFTPARLGAIEIKNRILMAPMTRSRAEVNGNPNSLLQEYYTQRAGAGLIISEGTQPSANGQGYCRTPGIYTAQHISGWQSVTQSVSANGGNMVLQIMHCGRVSSAHNKAADAETVAPSALQAKGQIYSDQAGMVDFDMPRALETEEIKSVIDEYQRAANNAVEAGFSGVELHATSGYLPAQFLSTGSNHRQDQYGGSALNRCRFVLEVLEAMSDAIGADRVGMRICPGNPFNDLQDDDPADTFSTLLKQVTPIQIAYLHVIRMSEKITGVDTVKLASDHFDGPTVLNDSYSFEEAADTIDENVVAISFARHFIANPSLVDMVQRSDEPQRFDPKTLYTPGSVGYTDYS